MAGGHRARWLVAAALVVAVSGGADAQTRLFVYGDSYVNPGAVGMRHGQAPWVALVGEPVVNLGHGGDGVARTLVVARRTADEVRGDVVLEVGINDLRRDGTDPVALQGFRTRYDEVLALFAGVRRVVVVPPLPLPRWGRTGRFPKGSDEALRLYREAVLQAAARHPNVRVADPLPAWRPDTMILPDGIHPNTAGRAVIATAVEAALEHR